MRDASNTTGMIGVPWRALDIALWAVTGAGFLWLMTYALPRQPAYALFMNVLGISVFVLALLRAEWSLMLMTAVMPGITTITVTLFNRVQPSVQTGVFGPAALVPVMAFVLGVWARAWIGRQATAPLRLRPWLLGFLALSVVSALVTCWRYSNFWPLHGWTYVQHIVNVEGQLTFDACMRVVWALANYLSGPLLLLAVCHTAARARARAGAAWCWRTWLLRRILTPLWLGSAAPFLVGRYQAIDVWFGANRVYVWPWMNRINATFFDPNSLGAYLILMVPWALALVALAGSWRWRGLMLSGAGFVLGISATPWLGQRLGQMMPQHSMQAYVLIGAAWVLSSVALMYAGRHWLLALPVGVACGIVVRTSTVLAGHAGSRTAVLGMITAGVVALLLISLRGLLTLRLRVSARIMRLIIGLMFVLYAAAGLWVFYAGAPRVRTWLQNHPKTQNLPLVKRLNQLPLGSFKQLYRQIIVDRGPYALLALGMMREAPLTGMGLGAFLTELPNWKQRDNQVIYVPDTACNFYLQIGAEQGVIALAVMLALLASWWRMWWQAWQQPQARAFWLWIGAGMASMLAMFIFGMHTLASEIQALFWLYMAQVCVVSTAAPRRWDSRYRWLLCALIGIVITVQTAAQLSLAAQQRAFGWRHSAGFYPVETHGTLPVRYTQQHASEHVSCDGLQFVQPWACFHANITGAPVQVTFSLGLVRTNVIAADNAWHTLILPVPESMLGQTLEYQVATSRTWTGRELGLNYDTRALGVALQPAAWESSSGLFDRETWQNDGSSMAGREFRWSGSTVRMLLDARQPFVRLPVLVPHPDVAANPVTLTYTFNGTVLTSVTYRAQGWYHEILFLRTQADVPAQGCLGISVSRTWRPAEHGMTDPRELGIAVGTPVALADTGFYDPEPWQAQFTYAWAGAAARWAHQAGSNGVINLQCLLSHPDIAQRPVTLRVWAPGLPEYRASISNDGWHACALHGEPLRWYDLNGAVDRTWQPSAHGSHDTRTLGFGVRR